MRLYPAPQAPRSASVLLCMASTSNIDRLVPALTEKIGVLHGSDTLLSHYDSLQPKLTNTWKSAWREQCDELSWLDTVLSNSTSTVVATDDEARLDLRALWRASDNSTRGIASPEERVIGARHVTHGIMRYWRFATPRNDENVEKAAQFLAGRETMTREVALKERRRQLRRHSAAGCVEYRIFGEVLARDEEVLRSLFPPSSSLSTASSSSCAVQLQTLAEAWRQLGGVANRTGWAEEARSFLETADGWRVLSQWLEEERVFARVGSGTAPWQRWWVVPPLQRLCTSVVCAGYAFAEGAREPPRVDRASASATTAAVTMWMVLLADTLRRSASNRLGEGYGGSNLFPLLLMAVPIARQGHIEAAAVYVLARLLGTLNSEALRNAEGFGASTFPERDVALVEAMNTEQTIVSEALALFDAYFASYSVETYAIYALFSLPLIILVLLSEAVMGAIDLVVSYGSPDPLAWL